MVVPCADGARVPWRGAWGDVESQGRSPIRIAEDRRSLAGASQQCQRTVRVPGGDDCARLTAWSPRKSGACEAGPTRPWLKVKQRGKPCGRVGQSAEPHPICSPTLCSTYTELTNAQLSLSCS